VQKKICKIYNIKERIVNPKEIIQSMLDTMTSIQNIGSIAFGVVPDHLVTLYAKWKKHDLFSILRKLEFDLKPNSNLLNESFLQLLFMAFTHKSVDNSFNYEMLEFLGDACLCLVTSEMVYKLNKSTEKRQPLLTNMSCAIYLKSIKLNEHINATIIIEDSMIADVCEAILAVVYLKIGLDAVKKNCI